MREEVAHGHARAAERVVGWADEPHSGQGGDHAIQRGAQSRGKRSCSKQSLHEGEQVAVRAPVGACAAGVYRVTLDPASEVGRVGRHVDQLLVVGAWPPGLGPPIGHHAQMRAKTLSSLLGENLAARLMREKYV